VQVLAHFLCPVPTLVSRFYAPRLQPDRLLAERPVSKLLSFHSVDLSTGLQLDFLFGF
jgi:hypothetical protein